MTREELKAEWARLRAIREERGLTGERLAVLAGVRVDVLRQAERGYRSGRRTLARVRAALEGER